MSVSMFHFYIAGSILLGFILLFAVNAVRSLKGEKPKWHSFEWSTLSYYCFLLPFVIPILAWLFLYPNTHLAVFFALSAVLGVLGESAFSLYWHSFFTEPFWHYSIGTFWRQYSSILNFIPWAVGGILYLGVARFVHFTPNAEELSLFWITFFFSLVGLVLLRHCYKLIRGRTSITFKRITIPAYVIALLPLLLPIVVTASLFPSSNICTTAIFFGVGAWIVEYLFGKGCVYFVSRRLWVYNHVAWDEGHITPLSIIPFAFGGFWFMTLYYLIGLAL
jgi:hypothetical protein